MDAAKSAKSPIIDIKAVNEKAAAILCTMADQLIIYDVKVNPISHNVYLPVSRGKSPDAIPVILRLDAVGKLSEFPLDNVAFSSAALSNAPASKTSTSRSPPPAAKPGPASNSSTPTAQHPGPPSVPGTRPGTLESKQSNPHCII